MKSFEARGALTDNSKSTPPEERMAKVASILSSDTGNQQLGKKLFQNHCGVCHRLFDEGSSLGPD